MILWFGVVVLGSAHFPRIRGDDPNAGIVMRAVYEFSPYSRG